MQKDDMNARKCQSLILYILSIPSPWMQGMAVPKNAPEPIKKETSALARSRPAEKEVVKVADSSAQMEQLAIAIQKGIGTKIETGSFEQLIIEKKGVASCRYRK